MDDFIQLWDKILSSFEQETVERVACLLRHIWLRHNNLIFKNSFTPPFMVVQELELDWEHYYSGLHLAEKNSLMSIPSSPQEVIKWVPAKDPWVKTNWDAAIDKEG